MVKQLIQPLLTHPASWPITFSIKISAIRKKSNKDQANSDKHKLRTVFFKIVWQNFNRKNKVSKKH